MLTNESTTSHRKAEEMAGQALIRETKAKGGVEDGGGGLSVPCVEIGRPELEGGKASKVRARPPHSHQLRGDVAPENQRQLLSSSAFQF